MHKAAVYLGRLIVPACVYSLAQVHSSGHVVGCLDLWLQDLQQQFTHRWEFAGVGERARQQEKERESSEGKWEDRKRRELKTKWESKEGLKLLRDYTVEDVYYLCV